MSADTIAEFMGDTKFTYDDTSVYIQTLEGAMTANAGDWIVKGVKGEHYPVKHVIFERTYEPVT